MTELRSGRASDSRAGATVQKSGAHSGRRSDAKEIIARARAVGRRALDEVSAKQVLTAFGIPVPRSVRIAKAAEIAEAIARLTPPLALKVISPEVFHKSDLGGVRMNLADGLAVRNAMNEMQERVSSLGHIVEGFVLEEMATGDHEVVIGGTRDPSFGQLIMFGLGGIFVEVLRDVSFRICPISRIDASEMIHEIRAAPILEGARGASPISKALLIDTLMAVGGEHGLLLSLADELAEMDINPLIVSASNIVAVDARLVLAGKSDGAQ